MHFSTCGVRSTLEVADLGLFYYLLWNFGLGMFHCTYLNRDNELGDKLKFALES